MKVIITFAFCCDNLWKSKFMALEKPGKLLNFYPRDTMLARSLRQRRVRLSGRLDVCLSHAGIVPSRAKAGS